MCKLNQLPCSRSCAGRRILFLGVATGALGAIAAVGYVITWLDSLVPYVEIPGLCAIGIGSLLVTLGVIVGRASVTRTYRPADRSAESAQVTATVTRPVRTVPAARELPDSAPSYTVLPAYRYDERAR